MNRSVSMLILALACGFLLPACKKGPALEELKKVEEACVAKDKEKAITTALKAAEGNSSFKKAFDEVFASVSDKKTANVCGGLQLSELKKRIENGPAL